MAVRDFIGNSVDSEVSAASVGISSAYTAVRLPPDVIVIINAGIVNQILRGVGLGALAQRWLADPKLAMGAVCSVSIFMIGIPIMYYTADLTTISRSILEAATIDGAGMKDQLLLIIFPVLKNTHKTIILSMLLGGFREMERVYLMTDGGPGGCTEIIGTYIYRATRSAGSNIGLVCVWLCSQSYEYFRYSEDLKTLKNKIYPSLRGSVLFCLDWMQQREDGLYYTAPSTSPENTFEDNEGHSCGVSYMTTMDLAIIKELFANYLAAADVLGIEEDLMELVKERSKLLPGYQIGKTGMIQEWIKDFEKSDLGHRHFSPIFGFHPGHSIKKNDTELVQACQNFIEEKAENFKQQIGWSCAWLINLWARLGDGTKANHYYEELLRQSVYDNLFDLHPPLGETEGEREVFQIDGNFGSASGVAEMLISSEKGKITILPALPDSWKNGKVRGLLAAGAIEVDITWKDRKPVSVSLCSSSDQNVSLFYRNRKLAEQIELKKQEQQIINLCSC